MRRNLRRQRWVLMVVAAWAAPARAQDTKVDPASIPPVARVIRGKVVDEAGKPVAGITLSTHWIVQEDQPRAFEGVTKTDDQGRFQLELTFYYGRSESLCALDVPKKRGGLAVIGPKTPDEPITIQAGPLVHVHGKYVCKELGTPVGWTNSMFNSMPENWRVCESRSEKGEFSVLLPPGKYGHRGYGGSDVGQHRRDLTLTADKPDVDLGEIDLAASALAKIKEKPAPTLRPTAARGVSKSVQIADYKGKWVALEFWGHWCGPCVAGAIPRMMEIYDDHPDERDRYVVLTVHAPDGKSFAEVDEKLVPIVRDIWAGRMMPFPILLDADGEIQKTFGVSHWPTTILFDPEGKLVGEVQPDELEMKLKPVPPAVALPRRLDRNTTIYFDNPSLKDAVTNLKMWTRAEYELDPETIRSLQQGDSTRVPLTISAMVSLRSALELLLDPVDLGVKVGPKGYVIARKQQVDPSSPARPSDFQAQAAARIERKLKESRYSYHFDKAPLEKVAAFFEQSSRENVVLDPKGRMQGKIDPKAPVTGSGKDVPMGEALEKLGGPLGLRAVVRDEVIVLEAGADRSAAAAR